jgi:arylamine N-acetyltransferase
MVTLLPAALVEQVLTYLGVGPEAPSLNALDRLLTAYTERVPWESASRIARRAQIVETADCPRWPDAFWESAIQHGTGGTCYESNYAFFSLLRALGYDGYLTINNMGESVGCHSALIIVLDGQPYLVDAGFPVHLPVPIDPDNQTTRRTWYHRFTVTPNGDGTFEVERDRHPKANCFTLINKSIDEPDYRRITTNDYGDDGLFLDRAIIARVIEDAQWGRRIWRFASDQLPPHIESFVDGEKTYHYLDGDISVQVKQIAARFDMDETVIQSALMALAQR